MISKIVAFLLAIILVVQILPLSTISIAINNENVVGQALTGSVEKNSLQVVSEIESLRDEYSKYFRCEDGSFVAAVYNAPIHYKENGEWKEIDNTLVANDSVEKTASVNSTKYAVTKTTNPITFPENINNGNITITKDDNIISFGVKDAVSNFSSVATVSEPEELVSTTITSLQSDSESENVEKENTELVIDTQNSAITYSNIFGNASIEYEVSSSMLKESIVVSEKSDSYKYEFWIDFGNYVPIKDEVSGGIYIYESVQSKEPIMAIAPPYMFDADGDTSREVTMDLVQNAENYTLIVEADKKWINKLGRKFPVVIDPTFILDVGRSNIYDVHVNKNDPTKSYKYDYQLEVGKKNNDVCRTYIKYNLPTLPDCSIVTNANLELIQNWYRDFDTDLYLNVYKCDTHWDFNTINWNNQPIQNLANATVVDYTNYKNGMGTVYNLDITKIVKDWYENAENHGLMLASSDETINEMTSFYSSRNIASNYPVITVQYVNNLGVEDYWTYDGFSLGESGSAYINTYNGQLTYIHGDVNTNGLLAPLSVSHVYSTDEKNATGTFGNMNFGKGFKLNLIEKIEQTGSNVYEGDYPYKYIDADGTVHFFKRESLLSNRFFYEFGSDVVLTSVNSGFVLTSPDGSTKEFNTDGYLTKTTDNNGNSVTITYSSGRITRVTDGGGISVTFAYNSDNTLNYISDAAGRKTYYHYNSLGQLDYITYPDSDSTQYSYNENSLLCEISAVSGAKAVLNYKNIVANNNTFYKVSSYTTYGEDSVTVYDTVDFVYRTCDTYIKNSKGDELVLAFDNSGRVTNKTLNGKTVSETQYNNSGDLKNTVSFASQSFDIGYNSFERGSMSVSDAQSDGTANNIINYSEERTFIKNKSLKLQRTETPGTITSTYKKWYIEPNTTYTVSMYVNIVDTLQSGEVYLTVTACDSDVLVLTDLLSVNGSAITSTDNQWQLISATITTPADTDAFKITCGIYDAIGTVYFDAFQIEKASTPSKMNLLVNGDFEDYDNRYGADSWNNAYNTFCMPETDAETGNSYTWLKGDPNAERSFWQEVQLNGKAGDILVFGASAKALCSSSGNDGTRFFGIRIDLYSDYSTIAQSETLFFDAQTYDTWQTAIGSVTAQQDYVEINMYMCYYNEVNVACFDNAFIYRDYYGTTYSYDSTGRIVKAESDNGQAVEYSRTGIDLTGVEVTANNQVVQTASYGYDSRHNLTYACDTNGIATRYTYNSKGLPVKTVITGSDGYSSTSTSYTYTSDNNYLKSVTDVTGATVEYTYNSKGLVSKVTEPNGNVTEYEYNPDTDELISVSNPSEALGNPSTEFEYDSAGRIAAVDAAEFINFYYDEFGRIISTDNLGILQTINGYNDDDNIEWQYYANDSQAEFFYDEEGRLTEEVYDNTLTYEYFYSNDGKLGKVADYESGEEWNYQYDMTERLTSVSSDDGRSLFYNYNTKNQLGSFKVLDSDSVIHETAYTYDNSGRVTGTQIPSMQGSPTQEYIYDSLGRSSRFKNYYNGNNYIEAVYSYRRVNEAETGQVQSLDYFRNGSLYGLDRRYEYDVNGNITHIYEGSGLIVRYKYDGMSRLIREDNYNAHKTVVYAYDSNGNMTSKTEYALSFTDELGTPVDTVTSTFNNGVWQSAITSYDGDWVFRYDMGGNPLSYRGYAMTWAKGRQLSALSGNGITASFKYNSSGIRTSKTVNGVETEYFYVGDTLISQKTGNEVINFAYTAGGAPLGFSYNGTPYYYMLNLQGDIEKIYDATGEVVVTYIYDAWGKLISIEDDTTDNIGVKNPLRYRGYYYDTETGFYYLQSRYYDPEICRFINADSLIIAGDDYIQGTNVYAYCYNNPVMYVDPTGYARVLGLNFDKLISLAYHLIDYMFSVAEDEITAWECFIKISEKNGFDFWVEGDVSIRVIEHESGVKQASISFKGRRGEDGELEQYHAMVYFATGHEWLKEYKARHNYEVTNWDKVKAFIGLFPVGSFISWYDFLKAFLAQEDPFEEGMSDIYDEAILNGSGTYFFVSYITANDKNIYLYHKGVVG